MNSLRLSPLIRLSKCQNLARSSLSFYSTADRTSDRVATNDPSPVKATANVSETNATPISPQGIRNSDLPLQESPEEGEAQRVMQAPNREKAWSRSQQPRERAMSGPRFEQTMMAFQVRPCCLTNICLPATAVMPCASLCFSYLRNRHPC